MQSISYIAGQASTILPKNGKNLAENIKNIQTLIF